MRRILSVILLILCSCCYPPGLRGDSLEAYFGKPFGVARLTISHTARQNGSKFGSGSGKAIAEAFVRLNQERVFYPVIEQSGITTDEPDAATNWSVFFLTRGQSDVSVRLPSRTQSLTAELQHDSNQYKRFADRWWRLYAARAQSNVSTGLSPVELEHYLVSMLARRLHRSTPQMSLPRDFPKHSMEEFFGIMAGTESVRLAMQEDALLNSGKANQVANLAVPEPVSPPPVVIPQVDGEVPIEKLAMMVPAECFYARFGGYEDFAWFRQRMESWGTDLRGLMMSRAVDYDLGTRIQRQLHLFDDQVNELIQPGNVTDFAVIGNDLFVREGAGIGVIFQAQKSNAFAKTLRLQRSRYAETTPGVSLTEFRLDNRATPVDLLSTASNEVRSFYVSSGPYHLITTSKSLVGRFLELVENEESSLGRTDEFRYARSLNAHTKDEAAFIYLSDQFIRQLVHPAFRIEMTRRAASEAELRVVRLAAFAARSEGWPSDTIEDLIDGGFLPNGFGKRADGSRLSFRSGRVSDSLRGEAGSFVPVADVEVSSATQAEVDGYRKFSEMYRRLWTRMDPATIAISRTESDGRQKLSMDLHVFPVPRQDALFVSQFLGPPDTTYTPMPSNCLMLIEADILLLNSRVFAGLLDFDIPFHIDGDEVKLSNSHTPGQTGFIGTFSSTAINLFTSSESIEVGDYKEIRAGGMPSWAYRGENVSLVGGSRTALEAVKDRLKTSESARAAQIRLQVGDIAKSRVSRMAHVAAWGRAQKIARANEYLPERLSSQLHIPPVQVWGATSAFLGGKVVCPFGGEYRQVQSPGSTEQNHWQSDLSPSWKKFRLPVLDQIRGAEILLDISRTTLSSHVDLWLNAD